MAGFQTPTMEPFSPTIEETSTGMADELIPYSQLLLNLDNFFLVTMGTFVIFMQAGFAFLECGSVRSKNSTNILIKNFMDLCIGGIAYWLFGYAFAFGTGNGFIGYEYFASYDLPVDKYSHWFFQYVFAATAASIVSGALAERCDTVAYFIYSFFLTGFIYPIISHWAWGDDGWLKLGIDDAAYQDFAGSGVVHLTGGIGSLVGALLLGPRIGRFDPNTGEPNDVRGHSVPFVVLGGMILVMGFFAFNGGSQGSISKLDDGNIVARAIKNTTVSGCSAAMVVIFLYRAGLGAGSSKYWSLLMSLNGCLTGMVAICAGCNLYQPWAACVIGSCAGVVYLLLHMLLLKLKIDDPLDATSVHLGGGLLGLIAAPFFMYPDGIVYSPDTHSGKVLGWNVLGATAILVWSGGLSFILFGILKLFKRLRVSPEIENIGLDLKKHGEPSYPAQSWLEEQYMNQQNNHFNHNVQNSVMKPQQGPEGGLPPNMFSLTRPHLRTSGSNKILGVNNTGFVSDEKKPDWSSTNL